MTGRRELHKQETRRALQEAAVRLFEQDGYDRTTVRDIAAAAGVTERTFFRYFATKEELVLGEVLDLLPVIREAVIERPAGETPYQAVRSALLALLDGLDRGIGILFASEEGATPSALAVIHQVEEALEDAFVARGVAAGLPASVLSKAATAAVHSTIETHTKLPEDQRTVDTARRLLGEAFALLEN
ncbi:TetR/AcrR family transcriptional regulator [Cryptosporangium arvum]|uniref:Transcriptional regulator n=1 Tax=Cryptosporangium arvum DSM 44712 TaxID=927661 RepID=A0A010Z6Q5_9ACTN|nr:TetR/AcrR family transcriptional regulator [Cryptosporangium arvum]EXG82993.1 transcriptional regulator [Cryptosporangium arvum DSM 44712]